MKQQHLIAALSVAALISACGSSANESATEAKQPVTAANAPKATARLQIAAPGAAAPAPFSAQAFAAPAGVTVDSAVLVIAEINLKGWEYDDELDEDEGENELESAAETEEQEPAEQEDGEDDQEDAEVEGVDFKGRYVVDLLTGVSEPAIAEAVLPAGTYSAIEFKLDGEDDGSQGSLEIAGSLVVDGVWYPFTLRNLRDEELKWSFAQPVSVTSAAVNDLVLTMPLDQWLDGALVAAMAQAVRDGAVVPSAAGVLEFTSETEKVADILEGNFEHEGGVDRDEEDDEDEIED